MAGENQSGMQSGPSDRAARAGVLECVEVEGLLAEALDGTLHGSTLEAFEAHKQSCASCQTMVEDAKAGMHWLKGLDEAEPPRNLVHNILAQTIGALPSEHAVPKPRGEGWIEKLKDRLAPVFAPVATPRFAMSLGMAFFSITLLLGIAGFHFADVRHWDLSSKGIRRTYYETQARVMRYYENMRLVYEIESRVRDLRRAGTPANEQNIQQEQQPQQQQEAPAPNPNPKNPSKTENRQHHGTQQNYSRDKGHPELAAFPAAPRAAVELPAALKGHAFRHAANAPYFFERALACDVPRARRRGPQQTPVPSLLGSENNRRTA